MGDPFNIGVLVLAAFFAGGLNAIAGGGSFLTFPALVYVGVPAIPANATSTVAVFPGYLSSAFGFFKELQTFGFRPLLALLGLAVAGGVGGGLLLLVTPSAVFQLVVPYLLLFATVLFAFGDKVSVYLAKHRTGGASKSWLPTLAVCTYGGYFNGGLGIVLLALFSAQGYRDLNLMNGLKNVISFVLSAASIVTFALAGIVHWSEAAIMAVAATVGGYVGAMVAKRLPKRVARIFIVCVGLVMTVLFFLR